MVTEGADPNDPTRTIRTVTYHGYVNEDGLILNGTESADYDASQVVVHDVAAITVTDAEGKKRGSLTANATVNPFQLSLTGFITSELDGDVQTLPDGGRTGGSAECVVNDSDRLLAEPLETCTRGASSAYPAYS